MTEHGPAFTILLCGDVMTGRGVDQILSHPSRPELHEPSVGSALEYVYLAELAHGPMPRAVSDAYVWGDALEEIGRRKPAARIVNLETSVTTSDDYERKGINYRMHPDNVGVLTAAGIDCAAIANNHVLDWGEAGLRETLDTLAGARIHAVGAGRSLAEARAPAALAVSEQHRVLMFALGGFDSGVPRRWCAGADRPGVNWLVNYSPRTAALVGEHVLEVKRTGDIAVASIHWGSNWGYAIPDDHRRFAHALIDLAGIDLVHGHSSHHPRAIEVYRGHLILYGCGDLLNDYEGIRRPNGFRDDLSVLYFPTIDARSGELVALEMAPLVIRGFQLQRPEADDARWLRETLDGECRPLGCRVVAMASGMRLAWT